MSTTVTTPEAQTPPLDQMSVGGAMRAYVAKVRGGDVGNLPAVLGFLVLVIFFSVMRPDTFATALNAANLINQSAAVIFIAMGLVFVLLLGEIDLSAGFAAGTCAAVLAVLLTERGVAWPLAVLGCLLTGALIGITIGLLVAKLGIPSFVVTLAAFLGLQGAMLFIIGEGGTIPVRNEQLLKIMNSNLSPAMGWVLVVLIVSAVAARDVLGARRRRSAGLPAASSAIIAAKVGALGLLLAVATYFLNQERSVNPDLVSLKGIPLIVPIALVFLVGLSFVLGSTAFGRHIYAVGGNAEAARRSGISVPWVRITCFIICSTMAAVAGILFASRDNSVSPTTGGSTTLLLAVGAAVIGGTSLFGGKGKVRDAIIGGLVVAVIANGLPLITSGSAVQYVVTALVLLLAAVVDALSRRRATSSGRA